MPVEMLLLEAKDLHVGDWVQRQDWLKRFDPPLVAGIIPGYVRAFTGKHN